MDIDIKDIETLLSDKKYDQVRSIINDAASKKFSGEEKGAALTGLASVYLEISNAINENYLSALQDAVAAMKEINDAENKVSEMVNLAEAREKLNK